MNILKTIHDNDVFPDPKKYSVVAWRDRPTAKVVLLNSDNEIALIVNKVNSYALLPGGGIEEGESIRDGVIRECREETGCAAELLDELGVTEDYRARDSKHCINYGFIGKAVSYGQPELTESEVDIGASVVWMPINDAYELFKKQRISLKKNNINFYNTGFNIIRDFLFIEKAIAWLDINKDQF